MIEVLIEVRLSYWGATMSFNVSAIYQLSSVSTFLFVSAPMQSYAGVRIITKSLHIICYIRDIAPE